MHHFDAAALASLHALLPHARTELARLFALTQATTPVVTVLGKYNHGKSTLLNTLIGAERFRVADVRETREVSSHEHDGVCWTDTPGLDADVAGQDDALAHDALRRSDLCLLVHALDAGELDAEECALGQRLLAHQQQHGAAVLLVLTSITEQPEPHREAVIARIHAQLPELTVCAVSASSYQRGLREHKPGLCRLGGIDALRQQIDDVLAFTAGRRQSQRIELIDHIDQLLGAPLEQHRRDLKHAENHLQQDARLFCTAYMALARKAQQKLEAV